MQVSQENAVAKEIPVYDVFKTPGTTTKTINKKRTPKRKISEEDKQQKRARPRTPSGQYKFNTISDLKTKLFNHVPSEADPANGLKTIKERNTEEREQNCEVQNNHSQCNSEYFEFLSNLQDQEGGENCLTSKAVMYNTNAVNTAEAEEGNNGSNTPKKQSVMDRYINDALQKSGQKSIEEATDPITMDIRTVIQMMEEMKVEIKAEIAEQFKNSVIQDKFEKASLSAKVDVCETKTRWITDAMAGVNNKVSELTGRMEKQEANQAKRMAVLTGLEVHQKKYLARRQIEDFLIEQVQVEVEIEDFYYIGKTEYKDIVITFATVNQKRSIFRNLDNIKHLRNRNGKRYSFRDFWTPTQTSFNKKSQQIANTVALEEPVDQKPVCTTRTAIYVGDEKYEPRVTAPEATSVLRYPLKKLNEILSISMERGDTFECDGNIFIPYSLCTTDFSQINDAYMKLRLNHAEARHIVCAWNVVGIPKYECSDGCDDGDHGVAEMMLQVMRDNNINNRVIYVVRKCGAKLNEKRTDCYIKAVRQIIKQFPENPVTGHSQQITTESPRSQHGSTGVKMYSQVVKEERRPRGYVRRGRARSSNQRYSRSSVKHGTDRYEKKNQRTMKDVTTYIPRDYSQERNDDHDQNMDQEEVD